MAPMTRTIVPLPLRLGPHLFGCGELSVHDWLQLSYDSQMGDSGSDDDQEGVTVRHPGSQEPIVVSRRPTEELIEQIVEAARRLKKDRSNQG
jgi:hypothetical protein